MSYTYITHEQIRVPAIRETEPAHSELYFARWERRNREQEFNRPTLKPGGEKATHYLESVAKEISHRSKSLKHQIFELGRLFCDIKNFLPYGKFDVWVEKETPHSKSTALNFMRVYEVCLGYPEVTQFFKPSDLYAICAPRFPEEFRDKLFIKAYKERRANDIGRKKLLEIVHKWKRGEVTLDSPEVQNLLEIEIDRDYFHFFREELETLWVILDNRLEKFKKLDAKSISSPLLENGKDAKADVYFDVLEMIERFIADIKRMIEDINPDLNRKRKSYVNAKVAFLENHKEKQTTAESEPGKEIVEVKRSRRTR